MLFFTNYIENGNLISTNYYINCFWNKTVKIYKNVTDTRTEHVEIAMYIKSAEEKLYYDYNFCHKENIVIDA